MKPVRPDFDAWLAGLPPAARAKLAAKLDGIETPAGAIAAGIAPGHRNADYARRAFALEAAAGQGFVAKTPRPSSRRG